MTDIRSSNPAQSWRNRSNWTRPDWQVLSDSQGGQPNIHYLPLTIIPRSPSVVTTWLWHPAHLTLELAGLQHVASSAFQGKGREELLIPYDSFQELTLAFVHTSGHPPVLWGAGIQSILSSVVLLVCEGVCLKEREHTKRWMLKCYITDCSTKPTMSGIRSWLSCLQALSSSTASGTALADRTWSNWKSKSHLPSNHSHTKLACPSSFGIFNHGAMLGGTRPLLLFHEKGLGTNLQ